MDEMLVQQLRAATAPNPGLNFEQRLGFWFQKIMVAMADFEKLKPTLVGLAQSMQRNVATTLQSLSTETRTILSGETSEGFHLKFLELQQVVQRYADKPDQMPGKEDYLAQLETYSASLSEHIVDVQRACEQGERVMGSGGSAGGSGNVLGTRAAPLGQTSPSSSDGYIGNAALAGSVGNTGATSGRGIGVGMPIKLPENLAAKQASSGGGAIGIGGSSSPGPLTPAGGPGQLVKDPQERDSMFPRAKTQLADKPDMQAWKTQQALGLDSSALAGSSGAPERGPTKLEQLFLELQTGMADFEQLKPLFGQVQPTQMGSSRLTAEDRLILSGEQAETLNTRLQKIQGDAERLSDPVTGRIRDPAMEPVFAAEVEKFVTDMSAHSTRVRELFEFVGLKNIPKPLPKPDLTKKLDPNAPEVRQLVSSFESIQQQMQIFERELAPKFAGVTQTHVAQASMSERDLLTGQESQALHVRFISLQARMRGGTQDTEFLAEVSQFHSNLVAHIKKAQALFDRLGVRPGAAPLQGGPINAPAGNSIRSGGGAAAQVNIATPSNFGRGAGGGAVGGQGGGSVGAGSGSPEAQVKMLFERVDVHMQKFETILKPLFKNVPAPQALMGKLPKQELKIATGQASEELHRRFLSLQQRANSQLQGPGVIQIFVKDLTDFEKDLGEHVVQAEDVLKRAGTMSQGSTEAYKKNNAVYTAAEIEDEVKKVEVDINEAASRLPKMLKRLKKRMKKELGAVAGSDKARVNREVAKLGHMLFAIKSAAVELMTRLRNGYSGDAQGKGALSEAELNEIFWGDFQLESQRFLATIRDLEKEDMQQARQAGGPGVQEVAATQGVKLTGSILGTSGVSKQDLEGHSGGFVARSQRETMPGQAGAGQAGQMDNGDRPSVATRPAGSDSFGLGSLGGGLGGLAKLPKLEL